MIRDFKCFKEDGNQQGVGNINLGGNTGGGANPNPDPNPNPNPDPIPDNLTALTEDRVEFSKTLGGEYLNATGDLVDKTGTVIKSKDEYEQLYQTSLNDNTDESKIELEGVEYKTNEAGDALNEDGTVHKTKAQIEEEYSDDDENTEDDTLDVTVIEKESGYQVFDEEGKPKVFESTPEGLAAREVALVKQEVIKAAKSFEDNFLAANPDVVDAVRYKRVHGSLKGYESYTDYTSVTLDPKNEEQLFNIIVESEVARGRTDAEARELATMFKDGKKLEEKSKLGLEFLQTEQAKVVAKQEADNKIARDNQIADDAQYWNTLKEIVVSNDTIKGIKVPMTIQVKGEDGSIENMTREDIFTYMYKPVTNHNGRLYTQYHIDKAEAQKKETEEDEALEVIQFLLGRDFTTIVDENVRENNVKKIKKYKKKQNSSSGGATPAGEAGSTKGTGNIKL